MLTSITLSKEQVKRCQQVKTGTNQPLLSILMSELNYGRSKEWIAARLKEKEEGERESDRR